MSNAETTQLVMELKKQEQDYEFYPTTKEIIACIHNHVNSNWEIENKASKVLDIGCGTENFRKYIKELHDKRELWKETASKRIDGSIDYSIRNATNWKINSYYVMEKSQILLQKLDRNTIVLGTDFYDNTLVERTARAKVDVVFVDKTKVPTDSAFDRWFDETFKMRDKEEKTIWETARDKENGLKNQLVGGANKGERLINLYEAEQHKLYEHFLAISGLDVDILESINIQKSAVKQALKERIQGLKTLYWKVVFDNLEEITNRLTSNTRNKMFNKFKSLHCISNGDNTLKLLGTCQKS